MKQILDIKSDNVFCTTVNNLHSLAIIVNEQRRVVYFNEPASRFFGIDINSLESYKPYGGELINCEQLSDEGIACGLNPECLDCKLSHGICQSFEGKANQFELWVDKPESIEPTNFSINACPIQIKDTTYCLLVMQELPKEDENLKLKRAFVNDIKNSATSIANLSKLLIEGGVINNTQQALKILNLAATNILSNIENQMHLLDNESNADFGHREQCNLHTLINYSISMVLDATISNKVKIEYNIAQAELYYPVVIDKLAFYRVLINLLINAIEASQPRETVRIIVHENVGSYSIHIHNNSYIPKELQDKLFTQRVSTKGKGRGFGMESVLALSKKHLNGHVSFVSTPDGGTTFALDLPADQETNSPKSV